MGQQELILNQLAAVHEGNQQIKKRVVQLTAEGIGASIMDFLTAAINDPDDRQKRSWQTALINAIHENEEDSTKRDLSDLAITPDRRQILQSTFIARLRYSGMEDREERIAEAYEETFQWIFSDSTDQEKPWSNFREWLGSDSQLYWMTGKAGSGKSTLMKYICHAEHSAVPSEPVEIGNESGAESERARVKGSRDIPAKRQGRYEQYLMKWVSGSRLITATYFFWNSGIRLQMSKIGLLRSLLTQILEQCPELVASVSPSRWESLCLFNDDPRGWSKEELERMLRSAVEQLDHVAKVCLFIDGLDEFDGKHDDLICLFQSLIANKNVKICVSSRPWVLFEDAFHHRPSLTLQDLTYSDIKHYVSSKLHKDHGFAQLRSREPIFAEQLVENVVSKASGVFLWVHLVVASLLAGMGFGDRVSDLQRRLDFLPPDLEDLYEKMLQNLDPFYLEHAAQLFTLVHEIREPPSLFLLSFVDEDDVDHALKQQIQALSPKTILLRTEIMRRRLNSRCKGLLEVQKPLIKSGLVSEGTVQYLHRTVKDYLQSSEVHAKLKAAMKSPFDLRLRLCAANLALFKTTNDSTNFLADKSFWARAQDCLYNASKIELSNRDSMIALLDELDRTGKVLAVKASENAYVLPHEARRDESRVKLLEAGQWVPFHPLFLTSELHSKFGRTFLSLATHYNVTEYIEVRAMQGCLVQQPNNKIWPLLADAICVCVLRMSEPYAMPTSVAMIKCLLDKGADPNFLIPSSTDGARGSLCTVWQEALKMRQHPLASKRFLHWEDIARLMIDHKADISKRALVAALCRPQYRMKRCIVEDAGRYSKEMNRFNEHISEILSMRM